MVQRISVGEYFRKSETLQPMELVYGIVREPPAPRYAHQTLVTHLGALLDAHVREHGAGQVCVSPVDVVLDPDAGLVVQPDIIFVAAGRLEIARDRVWGVPDLVVEVLSPGTAHRDRTTKLRWYRHYGVRECWLVDSRNQRVHVIVLHRAAVRRKTFSGSMPIGSRVLPKLVIPVNRFFE